ncbi:MAG: cytidine deaminase [Bacteroidetes bacterium]|nr:cytidine deaminase [Bacteroidota bacterium]
MKRKVEITYELLERSALSEKIQELINAAELAILSSHAPYSNFHVGAALLLGDKTIVPGSNQENASFPIGFCAERTALAAKISSAPKEKITAIAIATLNRDGKALPPIAPCGMCRQALLEEELRQQSPIKVYLLGNESEVMVLPNVAELLPFRFDHKVLDK